MADIIRLSGVPFQAALLPDFLSLPLHNLRQLFRKAIAVRIEKQTAAEILIFGDIITDYSDRWVMANVDEYAVGKLKVGQQIPLTSKAHPDTVFHGKIVNISKSPDFATKKSTNELNDQDVVTYEVKIALSEKDDIMLYPGMLVQVDLDKAGEKK